MAVVNKSEIAGYVAANNGLSKKAAEAVVNDVFQYIADSSNHGLEVNIKDFGKFVVKMKAARLGRNPKTGDAVNIAAKTAVSFKPAKAYKDLVNV